MKIALVQSPLVWEDPSANRRYFGNALDQARGADIIFLPEMFTTGFTMNPEPVAEPMDGDTVAWMRRMAGTLDAVIAGSVVIRDDAGFRNRFLLVTPDDIAFYDKRHLFSLAGEHRAYARGENRQLVSFRGWKICLQVCYDLRFPVFSRNADDYDLLVYVANWPEARISAWDGLLKARAIENMCYVAGVNRIGLDANGHKYPGHSQVVDYMGKVIGDASGQETVLRVAIEREPMLEARQKFGFLDDRDSFTVI